MGVFEIHALKLVGNFDLWLVILTDGRLLYFFLCSA